MNQYRRTQTGTYPASALGSFRTLIRTGEWVGNNACYELLGINHNYPHSIEGWLNLIDTSDRLNCAEHINKAHAAPGFHQNIHQFIRQSDGEKRYFSVVTHTQADSHGEPKYVIGHFHDITESVLDAFQLKIIQVHGFLHEPKPIKGSVIYFNL